MVRTTAKKKRVAIGAAIVGFFVLLVLNHVDPAPSLETASPNGQLKCYVQYHSLLAPDLSDAQLKVADTKTGEVVTVRTVLGGWFGEKPISLTWSADEHHFIYIDEREPGLGCSFYDVKTTPLRVENSSMREAKLWAHDLLQKLMATGSDEEKEAARKSLDLDFSDSE